MATMRTLAKANWAVVGLSATARTANGKHDVKELTMSSYRDSGEIEFNADSCYILKDVGELEQPYIRHTQLVHVKNRHGAKIDHNLRFHMPRMTFEKHDPEPETFSEFDEFATENPFDSGGDF